MFLTKVQGYAVKCLVTWKQKRINVIFFPSKFCTFCPPSLTNASFLFTFIYTLYVYTNQFHVIFKCAWYSKSPSFSVSLDKPSSNGVDKCDFCLDYAQTQRFIEWMKCYIYVPHQSHREVVQGGCLAFRVQDYSIKLRPWSFPTLNQFEFKKNKIKNK